MAGSYEEDHECVPFFSGKDCQIKFEFFYLVLLFAMIVICVSATGVSASLGWLGVSKASSIYSALGGLLGGWAYDAKWFYRVTARGKHNQYKQTWQQHKFYWRILIPFVAGSIAFAVYALFSSGLFLVRVDHANTAQLGSGLAFCLC